MEIKPAQRCGWQAWFGLDEVYRSDVTVPWKLPLIGLQVVVVYWDSGRREILSGQSDPDASEVWYLFWSGALVRRQEGSSRDDLVRIWPDASIVQGVWTTDADYNAIYARAWASRWQGPNYAPHPPRSLSASEQAADCGSCP